MQDEALVDVLIPVYNGVRYVRSAIESMQMQTVSDIRIHVVDDGSTDGTAEVLAEMAAQDPRLRIHSKANGGIVDALNTGLDFCTAEYIARHDADDIAQESFIRLMRYEGSREIGSPMLMLWVMGVFWVGFATLSSMCTPSAAAGSVLGS